MIKEIANGLGCAELEKVITAIDVTNNSANTKSTPQHLAVILDDGGISPFEGIVVG